MGLYVSHIVFKFQVNILKYFLSNQHLCVPTLSWAGQPTMNVEEVAISWDRPASMWR